MIELLVVIAIILILVGLLMPTLGQAWHRAQAAYCRSNFGQLQLGWFLYTGDFQEHLPRNEAEARGSYPGSDSMPGAAAAQNLGSWLCDSRSRLYEAAPGSWVVGNAWWDIDDSGIRQGTLWPYLECCRVYKCPADRSTVRDLPRHPRTRSVSMSAYMNPDPGQDNNKYDLAWHKLNEIRQPPPSDALVFVDEHPASINDGFFVIGQPDHPAYNVPWSWYDAPSLRHRRACAVSFADGHAEIWPMVEVTTGQLAVQGVRDTDRDLKRFYAGIPHKLPLGR